MKSYLDNIIEDQYTWIPCTCSSNILLGNMSYIIRFAIVYVCAEFTINNNSNENIDLFYGLPKANMLYLSAGNDHGTSMTFVVDDNGIFKKYFSNITTNDRYDVSFSYLKFD